VFVDVERKYQEGVEMVAAKRNRTRAKTLPAIEALTLRDAHGDVNRRRPAPDASLTEQRAFHQQNKRLYEATAEADRYHHHETLYWVEHERKIVEKLTEQIRRGLADANQAPATAEARRPADSSSGGAQ
jgi:hypothetical protein